LQGAAIIRYLEHIMDRFRNEVIIFNRK
jgi:hypothetical protein